MLKKVLLLSFCSLIACGVRADFVSGERYFNERNYSAAFNAFLPEADAGDKRSQYYVGYLYLNGLGVTQNPEKALEYLNASANKNYGSAQSLLGYLYDKGEIVSLNKKKAIELYMAAADQNDPSAMLNLGLAYYKGDGVVRDTQKAIDLLQRVPMDENRPYVGRYLGDIYMNSTDTNKVAKATKEYKKSARMGDIDSFYALGQIYENMDDLERAVVYYLYGASKNNAAAQYLLGTMYVKGKGVEKNFITGHAWLEIAANQRYEPAREALMELDRNMTIRQSEEARKEFNRIQSEIINNVDSPFIAEEKAERERMEKVKEEQKIVRRRR